VCKDGYFSVFPLYEFAIPPNEFCAFRFHPTQRLPV
jgi:hypothetical protein